MDILDDLIDKYYDKFVGLPNNKHIVRNGHIDDAFELVVLETLYGSEKEINLSNYSMSDLERISSYIVPPKDNGVDIVIEHESADGSTFDFVQVKNSELRPLDLQKEIHYMEESVNTFLKKPADIGENLRTVLQELGFSKEDKENCKFILVHRGDTNYFNGQEKNEQIITGNELKILRSNSETNIPKVPEEVLSSDSFSNFIEYNQSTKEPAIIFNLCGYDLAKLALKYTNSFIGRNILFGQNLRESINQKKSETYSGMERTIRDEPERFWFYNNGVTLLVEDYDAKRLPNNTVDSIILKRFSIINGAQTTSALGEFLKNANLNENEEDIEKLKKVFVLARVLKVNDAKFAGNIAVFNNTQNPITTRDMASQRPEQIELYNKLINGDEPHIYSEYRRGASVPNYIKLFKHQKTTNEELAQLAFAGFFREPFTAKDKKASIFKTDFSPDNEYLINEYYHRIFCNIEGHKFGKGILFEKTKEEINELLFVQYLYKESKKDLIKIYNQQIKLSEENGNVDLAEQAKRFKAVCNVCAIYCITYYYSLKKAFSKQTFIMIYDYGKFYKDKLYATQVIQAFRDLFLMETIKIINNLAGTYSLNTWIRDKKSADAFSKQIETEVLTDLQLHTKYEKYINDFKV